MLPNAQALPNSTVILDQEGKNPQSGLSEAATR
jgi:hypothetical protein